ncbi:hypothetical protein PINS_up000439 [Pythium insidiosum]|nr:hypothetical protein PINS_up000439 [Pythium insidiosum]
MGRVCSLRGTPIDGGKCKCSVGIVGEDCSNRLVCCSDRTKCWNPVCDLTASSVIVVSDEVGNDADGTGEMMDSSERGTAPKSVKSISKALSLVPDGGTIFLYPGVYKGALNRELRISSRTITIMSLKGFAWTTWDLEQIARALLVDGGSVVTLSGVTVRRGMAATLGGGALRVLSGSTLTLQEVLITESAAAQQGGAISVVQATVVLRQSSIQTANARIGGGIHASDAQVSMISSNVTNCSATSGGAFAVTGQTTLVGEAGSTVIYNEAIVDGGAVAVTGNATIKGLVIASNKAQRAAGVSLVNGGSLTMQDTSIVRNTALTVAGAIGLWGATTISATRVRLEANVAVTFGGGIFVQGNARIMSTSFPSTSPFLRANTAGTRGKTNLMKADCWLLTLMLLYYDVWQRLAVVSTRRTRRCNC